MSKNNKILLGMGPRRFGKTVVLAIIMTAGVLLIPRLKVASFATGTRISGDEGMAGYVKEAIEMSGNGHRIIKNNEEKMWISGDTPMDKRKIGFFPSNAQIRHLYFLSSNTLFFFALASGAKRQLRHVVSTQDLF